MTPNDKKRLPPWLRRPLPAGRHFDLTESTLEDLSLQTICMHANCPNRGQCWTRGTATVLILGNVCTRNCKFCAVASGKPAPPDPTEPGRLAKMVAQMKLKYLVMTSVNRDDLDDKGAGHFRDCVLEVRQACPNTQFEILTRRGTGQSDGHTKTFLADYRNAQFWIVSGFEDV
ncbi:MAG: lipoyl synthase, partial [Planctomycetes bacterium]|nr:lipoyl synthase [Planctomycetota bacterium]